MYQPKRLSFWVRVLLAGIMCWSVGSAFAQIPLASSKGLGKGPNPGQQRRDAALQELDAAVAARIEVDPQFKAFYDAVKANENAMKAFVKDKKAKKDKGAGK